MRKGLLGWLLGRGGEPDVDPPPPPQEESAPARVEPLHPETQLLRRFDDLGEVGRGGMAHIRRVLDKNLLRVQAMKILDPEAGKHSTSVERFIEEAQVTAQLDHPNIVPVHELGADDDGTLYFTMKLVSGRTLSDELRAVKDPERPMSQLLRLVDVLLKVCDGIAFAHSRSVIHRDLKPANIMVGSYGQVYVMDWGLARLLQAGDQPLHTGQSIDVSRDRALHELDPEGLVVGSPRYMAPEQAAGLNQSVDERSDVFSLGALLYTILTGRPPFDAADLREAVLQAQKCRITPPEKVAPAAALPPGLCRIAMKAMAPRPDDRYPSVLVFKSELEVFLRGGYLPTRMFRRGELIVAEGESGDTAYIIASGRCQAYKMIGGEKVVLRQMGPGEVFGETAILSAKPRTASVEALEDMTVQVVTAALLTDGVGWSSWVGAFARALAERFREADERLTLLDMDFVKE